MVESIPNTWQYHDMSLWGDDFETNAGATMRRFGTILSDMSYENVRLRRLHPIFYLENPPGAL
jgi:hypothetical protein